MDSHDWRSTSTTAEKLNNMDSPDWRSTLQPDSRQIIVNEIMETLQRHLSVSGPDGLVQFSELATSIEERIFINGTSQWDYLQKVAMEMVSMETKSQTTGMAITIQSNSAASAQNPPDSGVQCSANFPSVTSLTQTSTLNAAGQSINMQYFLQSTRSQGLPSNILSNSQYLYLLSLSVDSSAQTGQDAIDRGWRTTLRPDSRQIQVNRILEALKICYPIAASKALVLLYRMARLSETDIYCDATSNSDYLRKVYLEILKLKTGFRLLDEDFELLDA